MNQDQVKEMLLRLESNSPEFQVVFTGKSSRKVNGLYKPDAREILLHNKNFSSDEELIYTAIHEFAHHLHFCSSNPPSSSRTHNGVFWSMFHRLLAQAEEMGLYRNLFKVEPEFSKLTEEIRTKYLVPLAVLTKDLGQTLLQAVQLCGKYHVRFEDYMDRVLCIPRNTVKSAMASFAQDISTDFGPDHLKLMAGIKDPEIRRELEVHRREGASVEMLKQEIKGEPLPQILKDAPPIVSTKKRRERLEARLARLEEEAEEIRSKLKDLEEEAETAAASSLDVQLRFEF